jgi:hypothetical protein
VIKHGLTRGVRDICCAKQLIDGECPPPPKSGQPKDDGGSDQRKGLIAFEGPVLYHNKSVLICRVVEGGHVIISTHNVIEGTTAAIFLLK